MQLTDLIPIAKVAGVADDGFIALKPYKNFLDSYLEVKDLFLVFKDNRVRYVTLTVVRQEKTPFIKIREIDVLEEITKPDEVQVRLAPEQIGMHGEETEKDSTIGKRAVFQEKYLGTVSDWFHNGAHNVLVITMENEHEVMIPDVDQFVLDETDDSIIFQNIGDLLEL